MQRKMLHVYYFTVGAGDFFEIPTWQMSKPQDHWFESPILLALNTVLTLWADRCWPALVRSFLFSMQQLMVKPVMTRYCYIVMYILNECLPYALQERRKWNLC